MPPIDLLRHHQRIAFVGATNGQLFKILKQAIEERISLSENPAWAQLEFFTGTDALLEHVERDNEVDLQAERNKAEEEIRSFLELEGIADQWAMYRFAKALSPRLAPHALATLLRLAARLALACFAHIVPTVATSEHCRHNPSARCRA